MPTPTRQDCADSADDDTRAAILFVVDDLGDSARPADLGAWIVVESTSTRISLLRPYDEPVDGRGMGVMDDHDSRVFELLDALPSSGEAGWMVTRSGPCALSLDPAPLSPAIVQLDGSAPPDAGSPSLSLLVTEWACNSGRDAAGRVRLISLDETDDTVSIRVGVEPEDGAQTCPSNPTTSFVVDLASPLGDREIVDGSLVTPRPLPTGSPVVID
ncbi:hypothetical protein [Microbacterium marinilacus]|uniref:Uncharacterized protein n=1 Tax=Microbacterium marinilacus TaxID=415209 RepID=A0ABP7BMT8_9MICO|nr:hypothetical protein [Microbacterium marinilacus]MBY0689879.1 hypothetical protein [Microbacterium marinilacus]